MAENRSSHRNNDGSLFRESSKLFIQFYLFPADSSSKKSETAEGILLDPVYTGKVFAGMLDLIEKGQLGSDEPIIFLHTGGLPALFAFES